ncbi:MAG: aerial mycelium formation protein, partial [Gemmatimonadetes bacterium]|nr:aerial mycelium formation protein [Gemmatimonadota bacterium]
IVHAEQRRRRQGGSTAVVAQLSQILAVNAVGPATGSGRHQTLRPSRAEAHRRHTEALLADVTLSNVAARSSEQLQSALREYRAEEASVSARRREVQRVVDALNAEIGARYASGAASVDELLAGQRRGTERS